MNINSVIKDRNHEFKYGARLGTRDSVAKITDKHPELRIVRPTEICAVVGLPARTVKYSALLMTLRIISIRRVESPSGLRRI